MKRLAFKPEFVNLILTGKKLFTSRFKDPKLRVGDIVAAVTSAPGKPAFLTPASEAFCHVQIMSVSKMAWKDFTAEDAAACCVDRSWYGEHDPSEDVFVIGFVPVQVDCS